MPRGGGHLIWRDGSAMRADSRHSAGYAGGVTDAETEARVDGAAPAATGDAEARAKADGGVTWEGSSWGVDWHLELDRRVLLPGRLVDARVLIVARHDVEARGLVVTLRAVEHWRHRVSQTDANGNTTTHVVTTSEDAVREPVQVHGP